jgi:hypothetical protein
MLRVTEKSDNRVSLKADIGLTKIKKTHIQPTIIKQKILYILKKPGILPISLIFSLHAGSPTYKIRRVKKSQRAAAV